MSTPEIIDLVHDTLKAAPELAGIRDWNKANGLVTMAAPGCSIGLEREVYEPYTGEQDEVTAHLSIIVWVKNIDPAAGEAEVRALAQEVRMVLTENRTLGGAAADGYVNGILYTTAEGGKNLLLHLAEIDYRVRYYSPRFRVEAVSPIENINHDVGVG